MPPTPPSATPPATLEHDVAQLKKDVAELKVNHDKLKTEVTNAETAGGKSNTDLAARVKALEDLVGKPGQ